MSRRSFISRIAFCTLKIYGSGIHISRFLANILASLYAGKFCPVDDRSDRGDSSMYFD
jgi:hypothetical protein